MTTFLISIAPYVAGMISAYAAYLKVKQDTFIRKQNRDIEIELIKKDILNLQNSHGDFKKDLKEIKDMLSSMSQDIAVLKSKVR
jgi:hypothetical protein